MKVTVTLYNHHMGEKEINLKAKTYDEFKKEFPKYFGNMRYYASNKAQNEVNTIVTDDMYQELTYFENKLNYLHKNHNVLVSGLHLSACSIMKTAYEKHEMINKQAYTDLIEGIKD